MAKPGTVRPRQALLSLIVLCAFCVGGSVTLGLTIWRPVGIFPARDRGCRHRDGGASCRSVPSPRPVRLPTGPSWRPLGFQITRGRRGAASAEAQEAVDSDGLNEHDERYGHWMAPVAPALN